MYIPNKRKTNLKIPVIIEFGSLNTRAGKFNFNFYHFK